MLTQSNVYSVAIKPSHVSLKVFDTMVMCGKPGLTALTKYTANQLFDPEDCSDQSQVVDKLEMCGKLGLTAVTRYSDQYEKLLLFREILENI